MAVIVAVAMIMSMTMKSMMRIDVACMFLGLGVTAEGVILKETRIMSE
jgi:hypothetical protein